MKSFVAAFVASLLVVTLLAASIMLPDPGPAAAQFRGRDDDPDVGRHGWLSNLAAGKERARTEGKPLMVVIRCLP